MVFRSKDARTYKLRLSIKGRKPRTVSTEMTVKSAADDMERWVKLKKGRGHTAPLVAVLNDRTTLAAVYDADMAGTLAEFMTALDDADLDPLVTEWAKRANEKYVRQVRTFLPEGERFPASRLRRAEVSRFLAGLDCSDPTRNRYRAALSVFAKWLVEREIIDANPVRDVAMYKEHDPRMVWMPWAHAARVANAAPSPYREMFAVMAATGIELGVALRLTAQSVDVMRGAHLPKDAYAIQASGSKTAWRNRVVLVEEWAHPHLARRLRLAVGAALLFPGTTQDRALDVFQDAQKAVGLSGHRLHDLRHTYAVNALKQGYKPQVVAHQLGHKDSTMVSRVYGRFIPDAADYQTTKPQLVTNSVTTPSRKTRGKRA